MWFFTAHIQYIGITVMPTHTWVHARWMSSTREKWNEMTESERGDGKFSVFCKAFSKTHMDRISCSLDTD